MKYDTFSDLMSNFKDLHREIPATDPRSAPLVEFYKYWSNYLEPTPAYLAFMSNIWGTLAKGLYFITASLEHVFNNMFKLFGLFGYLGNQDTIIGQFFYWFQLIGVTLFTLILVVSAITGVFTKPVKYKGVITNFLLVTFVTSVFPMALTAISTSIAQDAQNIQTVKSATEDDSSYFSSLAVQPMKNNVVDLKVLIDKDFSTELFPLDDQGFIKPPKEGSTPVNNITDSPDKRDTSDFASRIDFSATFGATDSELLDALEKKQKGLKGLFLHQLNATQDGILAMNEHKFIGQLNSFEPVYKRYKVNWIGMFAQYIILIVLLASMAIKLVKSIFDIVIQALISPLVGYTSLSSSKKYKELLRTAGGALAGIFFEVVIMRVTMEILRDLPTLAISAVTKLSGGFFDGLNSWEQMIAACVVYIGVFLAAMQGVTMIERWLGVSTGHSDTAQQLIGAMMAGQAFATGAGAVGNGAMAMGSLGLNVAKKTPGVVASGSKILGNSLATTGGGIRGTFNSVKDQGLANTAKGGLSNMYSAADLAAREAVGKVKDFAGGVSDHLSQKEQAGHDAVYRGLKDNSFKDKPTPVSPYDPDANFAPSGSSSIDPMFSDDAGPSGGGITDPTIAPPDSSGEDFGGISEPTPVSPQEAATQPKAQAPLPNVASSAPKKPKGSSSPKHHFQQSMHQMNQMNQQMKQASQRMQGQSHIRGAEIEEDDS
ncbi:pLS20_p028 family conjugation system transmembrane protein [Streptococcus hyointestinalis]|uniref:pLS20_p028 family conjugation system transmembrane protein n=1 Tax=Streptococcus hyointestinalis TaxID=1337 RepID=UPI003D02779A